jgi:hypothetical protein
VNNMSSKVIKQKITLGKIDEDFYSMLKIDGKDNGNKEILTEKYLDCRTVLSKLIKSLAIIPNSNAMCQAFPEFHKEFDQIDQYCKTVVHENKLDEKDIDVSNINELYNHIAHSETNQPLISFCAMLKSDYKHFIDKENERLFTDHADRTFKPMSFTDLNFYDLWKHPNMDSKFKNLIFSIFKKILEYGYNFYEILVRPAFDVKEFSQVLVSSLAKMKKHIPRCDEAFDAIEKSIGTLENNFTDYYKDYIVSQNQGIIIERYIGDIIKQKNNNTKIIGQLRKITNFYQQHMVSNKMLNNPKMAEMFKMMHEKMDAGEQKEEKEKPEPEEKKKPQSVLTEQEKLDMFGISIYKPKETKGRKKSHK